MDPATAPHNRFFSRSRQARAALTGAHRLISHTLTAGQLNSLQAVLGITRPGLCMQKKKNNKNSGSRVHLEVINQCHPGTTCTQFPPSISSHDGANTSSPRERKKNLQHNSTSCLILAPDSLMESRPLVKREGGSKTFLRKCASTLPLALVPPFFPAGIRLTAMLFHSSIISYKPTLEAFGS